MARVLVTYASKHGSTAEIAGAIADEIRARGHEADCAEAGSARDVQDYDVVVLGSAVYMKRWRREARRFLSRHRRALEARPLWIFSSGPVGDEPDESWSEPADVIETVEKLGAREHVVFGGRVRLDGSFMERSMAQNAAEENRDLRDWEEIRAWAASIAAELAASP